MNSLNTSYYSLKRIVRFLFSERWYNQIKLAAIIFDFKLNRPYEISELLSEIISPDAVVLDIGANMGHYACRLNEIVKNGIGSVYSFEPVKANFTALKQMKKVLKLNKVVVYHMGISDVTEEKEIYIPKYHSGLIVGTQASLFKKNGINYNVERIKVTTIDTFFKENKLTKVDFIKCDTEGNENKVLEGAKNTITKFLPVLSFEMSHKEESLKWLIHLGYYLYYYDPKLKKLRNIVDYQNGNLIMINKSHPDYSHEIIK